MLVLGGGTNPRSTVFAKPFGLFLRTGRAIEKHVRSWRPQFEAAKPLVNLMGWLIKRGWLISHHVSVVANYNDVKLAGNGHPKWWFNKGTSPKSPKHSGLGIILTQIGGGNSKTFWNFQPDPWGFMIQFDGSHIFQRGWFNHQLENHSVFRGSRRMSFINSLRKSPKTHQLKAKPNQQSRES